VKVEFLKKFSKDIDKIKKPKEKNSILEVIELIKSATVIEEVSGVKKLTGFDDAFRIRSGDYRIGIFIESDTIAFARVAHRKEIYRIFP
jgi:mRNA interferase RelE/StbE